MKEFYSKINFLVATFVSILGFTLVYEVISEDDPADKIDDALMVVLGIVAIWWYKKSGYKGSSAKPAILISGVSVLIKIMAVIIEHADKEAVGDDIGILLALILLFVFITWQVLSRRSKA
jgi:hypothetical protein